jgi:hypothetical protein
MHAKKYKNKQDAISGPSDDKSPLPFTRQKVHPKIYGEPHREQQNSKTAKQ